MANEYASVEEFKNYLSITDFVDDTLLDLAVSTASRAIDEDTGRRFWLDSATSARYYSPDHYWQQCIDTEDFDPGTSITVALDADGDGTFQTTITDYFATPVNTTSPSGIAYPYNGLSRVGVFNPWPVSITGRPTIKVTAKWGWPAVPDAVKQATLILAKDIFMLKDNVFGVAGFGDFGAVRIRANVYVDQLLEPYRRLVPLVG